MMSMKSFATCAPRWPLRNRTMNASGISGAMKIQPEPTACAKCGSTSRVGRDLCLNCLLQTGLGAQIGNNETLDGVLAEIDMPDADWRLGNYQILEEIGRGGMGVIYRARQRHSRRIVALKRILSYHADSRETLARFRREAEAAASLDHPNILPIYEVSEGEDGLPFFSMKFAPGGSLLDAGPALREEPRRSVALMAKVARAVQYAHVQGILHRDLKPGNIMLDGRGEPLVSDFGLAKWLDTTSDLTRTLTIFGTPGYIAPEQARGPAAKLTPAADVYSLGAILFDVFTGRPPFLGEHALAVIQQAAEKPAPKLRTLAPALDRDLETICARCLERESHARYQSAGDLAEDLERWLEGRPIITRPVSPPVHVWRWSRRNPVLASSFAACLVLGTAAVVWQIQSRQFEATVREGALASRSIAILPFLDLDRVDRDNDLTRQIAESLHREFTRREPVHLELLADAPISSAGAGSPQIVVAAGTTAKTRTVMTGTKRTVDGKSRILIRVMNSATGEPILMRIVALDGDKNLGSVTIQAVVPELDTILNLRDWSVADSGRDPGLRNEKAREFIIAGRELMLRENVEDLDRSIHCLERAIKLEPQSPIAHAYLATAACSRTHYISDREYLRRAEEEARTAVRLSPESPEAHRALAGIGYTNGRFKEALEEELRAVEMGGLEEHVVSFLGLTFKTLGLPNRALAWLELARKWETRPGDYDSQIGDCWVALDGDNQAEAAYRRAADLHPEMPQGWIGLARLRLLQGDAPAARKIWQENRDRHRQFIYATEMAAEIEFFARNYQEAERLYRQLARDDTSGGGEFYGAVTFRSALGRLRQILGDKASGKKILTECLATELFALKAEPGDAAVLYRIAAICSSLGQKASAISYLRAATSAGWTDRRSTTLDPRFDALASDLDFQSVLSDLASKAAGMRQQTIGHTGGPM
jgi:serine/threonine protein kinase/tetratricopeptide (TPR) repeat protein/TolB-like protein